MEITEVRVRLVNVKNDKLRGFCSITLDNDFVIRDLKIIEGAKGAFVAMPSRKLTERCPRCSGKNHFRARFCNDCGARLGERSGGDLSHQKIHTDIAHPINSRCREAIQKRVLEVFQEEVGKSSEPGYRPMELEVFDEDSLLEEVREEISPAPRLEGPPAPAAAESTAVVAGTTGERGPEPVQRPGPSRDMPDRDRNRGPRQSQQQGPRGTRDDRRHQSGQSQERGGHRPGPPQQAPRQDGGRRDSDRRGGGGFQRPDRRDEGQRIVAAPAASSPPPPPMKERVREASSEPEAEDNFGAGLFN